MNLPLTWLGIGYAPILLAREGLPTLGSSAYGHSQPFPMNEPTRPFEKTRACCGLASSPVLFARERDRTIAFSLVRPWIACGELRVPCHLSPFRTAIFPP